MKKRFIPFLLSGLLLIVGMHAFAQGYGPGSSGYAAEKASHIVSTPAAPYVRPTVAGLSWTDGCYINWDDSYSILVANDDSSTGLISLPFTFTLYGTTYTSLYVNNNGNITFGAPVYTWTSSGFPMTIPMIAPFWADVMTTTGAELRYKVFDHKLIATWSNVGYYYLHYAQTDSFQLIITDGTDASIGLGNNVAFHYGQMNWTTGDASGGVGGFGGTPATVGVNAGDGVHFIQVGRFGVNSSSYTGSSSDISNGVHYLEYQCFSFNVSGSGNIPPSVSGLPSGNIDTIVCGDTHTYFANWIGPETDQSDSSSVDTGDVCNMTVHQTSGFTSVSRDTISITGSACNMGVHHFYVTGYDNMGGVTIDTITIVVVPFVPDATSDGPVCSGNSLHLMSATGGAGTMYSWTGPGGFTSTMQNPIIETATTANAGMYHLTVTTPGGCSSVDTVMVTVHESPTAVITASGPLSFCEEGAVALTVSGGTSQLWSTMDTTSTIIVSTSGTYYATVTDSNGCLAFAAPVVVTVNPAPAAIAGSSPICTGATLTLTDATTGGTWSVDSSGSAIASVSTSGTVTGISSGTVKVTYSLSTGCYTTTVLTVNPTPLITGSSAVCMGHTNTLSASVTGGTWSSSNTSIATVSSSGVVSGLAIGSAMISYILPTGCMASTMVFVSPTVSISASTSSICAGSTLMLTATGTGSWSSSNTSVATVNSEGIVTGVTAGSATISFSSSGGCAGTISITILPNPAPIAGSTSICVGTSTILTDASAPGISWISSNTSVATVGSLSGSVTGVSAGTSTITFTATNGCKATAIVTINAAASSIIGGSSVCVGSTLTLSNTSGGTWSSSATSTATVGSSSGIVTGMAAGTATITFTTGAGCSTTKVVTVLALPAAITGATSLCAGSTATLSTTSTGGTWSSSNNLVATISGSGLATAVAAGTVSISYTGTNGCSRIATVTVGASVPAITGNTNVCVGIASTLSNSIAGGTWSSSNTSIATVNSTTGVVNGVTTGSLFITYSLGSGCYNAVMITVNPTPAAIGGATSVCVGSAMTLTDGTSGGSWSSSNTSIATVDGSGIVTGLTAGTVSISYIVGTGCYALKSVTVKPVPAPIVGNMSICVGSTSALSDPTTGGMSWSSSNTSVATVNSGSSVVTGVSAGTATITYTLSTGCYITAVVTINPLPSAITGSASLCAGTTTTLSVTSTSGGTWNSGTPTIATIGSTTGIVTGVTNGTSRVTFTSGMGCRSTIIVTVLAQPGTIGGTKTICLGSTSTLTSTPTGGTWSSGDTAIASVNGTGVVMGTGIGTTTISYTNTSGCSRTAVVTVNSSVPDIMGGNTVCVGKTLALSDSVTGGTWSSSNTSMATVTVTGGVVTGVASGTIKITYTLSAGCRDIMEMTVNPAAATITGTTAVCVGSSITLSTTNTDGSWSSSNTSLATVDMDGNVTGVTAGSVIISYILPTGCYATKSITVRPLPAAIGGPTSVCLGSTITLTDATSGGQSWTSSITTVATVGSLNGVVTGVSEGTTTITYTLTTGCSTSTVITVNPLPSAITGTPSVCIGGTTTLSVTSTSGGTWSSGSVTKATVGSATGIVTGVAAGTSTITFTSSAGCRSTVVVTVSALPNTITGTMTVCAGSTTTLSSTTTGGSWSSDDMTIATVSSSGVVTGVSVGTVSISYTSAAGCSRMATVTVNAGIGSITGSSEVCVGRTTTLSDSTTGGTWSSSSTTKATVNSSTGVVTGVSAGTVNITYAVAAGCNSVWAMTVNPAVAAISGTNSVCAGSSVTLSTASTGGSWSSGNTSLATVDMSGVVTGVSAGSVLISYILPTGCYATYSVMVKPLPAAISGTTSICTGGSTTLTDATTGGVSWTSSDPSVATIGAASGVLTGVSVGTATITYTISTGCSITTVVTVDAGTSIMGSLSVCMGSTTGLSASASGGTWSSSNSTVASITSTGLVTGNTAGTATITYSLGTACYSTVMVTVNALPNTITGTTTICMGSTSALNSTTSGGTWSSSNDTIASVSSSGVVTGNALGTAMISYTSSAGCARTAVVTITSGVASIVGSVTPCVGVATTMTDATSGGTWSSSNTSVATIVSSTGVLTGVSSGTSTITYAVTPGCRSTITVTVGSGAGTISGPTAVCAGSMISLSTTGTGGTWATGDASIATVDAGGSVTGVSAGTVSITYMLSGGCMSTYLITVKPVPSAISGSASLCVGGTVTLTDATSGGVSWSSSDSSVATIGSSSGVLTAMGAGTATITYTIINGCYTTTVVTINSLPSAITGTLEICQGTATILTSATTGGSWSSSGTSIVTVGTAGDVVGVAGGTSTISYSLGGSCVTTVVVTIDPLPAVISGGSTVCTGSTITLTDATSGGSWSSADSSIATVSSSGVVSGMSTGTVIVSYTLSTGCGRAVSITVAAPASAITGSTTICVGNMTTLGNATSGGTWSSSNTTVATIGSVTGIVTGLSAGTTGITYVAAPGCTSTAIVTVNTALPANTGTAVVTVGATTTLSNSVTGGSWVSSNPSYASVTSSGVVTGVAVGNPIISYIIGGCYANTTMTVNPAIAPIMGSLTVCEGTTSTLTDATPGGMMWVSSVPSVATIGSISGVVTGVAAGTTTISYVTTSGTIVTAVVTVNATPPAITGPATVCVGSTITKADATTGGTWSTSSTTFGTIDAITGVVTGISAGTTMVTYNVGGCVRTIILTVNAIPAAIAGFANVCTGTSVNFTTTSTGGTWSSSDATVATVGSTGTVTGVVSGNATISYTFTTGCARTYAVTVSVPTANGGGSNLCKSATTTLTNATTGGTWATSNPSIATIGATTGIASGVATGTVNLTYTINSSCKVVTYATVNPAVGAITGTASVCLGLTTSLADTSVGGSWVSSNPSLGSVSSSGVVTGLSVGTPVISYVMPTGCYKSVSVPVKALPSAIVGSTTVCTGSTTTLTDPSSPGAWSSSTLSVGTIGATSGVVRGITEGTTVITFTATATGCYTTRVQTVNTAGSISGPTSVSISASTTTPVLYTDATTGGTWSTSSATRATIDAGGNLTGHAAGAVTVSYSANGCVATYAITITTPRAGGNGPSAMDEPANGIQLFPNPTSGALSIKSAVTGTFTVYAIDGKVIGRYGVIAGQTDITLPKELASGNYVCRFAGDDGSAATIQLVYNP